MSSSSSYGKSLSLGVKAPFFAKHHSNCGRSAVQLVTQRGDSAVEASDGESEHVHASRDREAQFHEGRARPALEGFTQLWVRAVEQARHDRQHPSILGHVVDVQVLNGHASILRDSSDYTGTGSVPRVTSLQNDLFLRSRLSSYASHGTGSAFLSKSHLAYRSKSLRWVRELWTGSLSNAFTTPINA